MAVQRLSRYRLSTNSLIWGGILFQSFREVCFGSNNHSSPQVPEDAFKLNANPFVLSRPPALHLSLLSYSGELGWALKKLRDCHHFCFKARSEPTLAANVCSFFLDLAQKTKTPSTQTTPFPPNSIPRMHQRRKWEPFITMSLYASKYPSPRSRERVGEALF